MALTLERTPISGRHCHYQEVEQTTSSQPALSVAPHAATVAASPRHRRTYYRGGFRTSICDIFRDPYSHTDCCAVVCCGVLASDRNRYLLTGERPPSLWQRILMYFIVPALFVCAINYFTVDIPIEGEKDDIEQKETTPRPELLVSFFLYVGFMSYWGRRKKWQMRSLIMTKLYEERLTETGQEMNPQELHAFLGRHKYDIARAHPYFFRFYKRDDHFYQNSDNWGHSQSQGEEINDEYSEEDCCTFFWKYLSEFFGCCSMWCQVCGACAISQEEREVNRLTSSQQQEIDYITFQPFSEYFPSIQYLRDHQISSPWKHMQATSQLSRKIIVHVSSVLVMLILFALSDIDSNFTWENLIVLLLTLGQAFFIECLVHWTWNRFNLSFDSVAKYFACGFFLATPLAIMFESIVSILSSIVVLVIALIALASDNDLEKEMSSDSKAAVKDLLVNHTGIFVFIQFVNAFCVAALVEEMVKYFSYRMVVTPDLNIRRQSTILSSNDAHQTSKKSIGSGITVAMVSVALGFACCENLLYVFVYSPPSIGVEISTLLARSFFPVHPLCAAIQSLGVCKRDLECDKRHGLGRILFPAVVLHGTFDFILMLATLLQQVRNVKEGNDDDSTDASPDNENDVDLATQIPALISGLVLMFCGFLYYVTQSRAQTRRLIAADDEARVANSHQLV